MARNAISKVILDIQNGRRRPFCKNKFCNDLKWPEMRSEVNFGHPKWPIDLKWPEIRLEVIFGHPKLPPAAILSQIANKIFFRMDLKCPEIRSKVNFGHSKWWYRSEMLRNSIKSAFWTSKNGCRRPFKKKHLQQKLRD